MRQKQSLEANHSQALLENEPRRLPRPKHCMKIHKGVQAQGDDGTTALPKQPYIAHAVRESNHNYGGHSAMTTPQPRYQVRCPLCDARLLDAAIPLRVAHPNE